MCEIDLIMRYTLNLERSRLTLRLKHTSEVVVPDNNDGDHYMPQELSDLVSEVLVDENLPLLNR